jgi:hypothetical protein
MLLLVIAASNTQCLKKNCDGVKVIGRFSQMWAIKREMNVLKKKKKKLKNPSIFLATT